MKGRSRGWRVDGGGGGWMERVEGRWIEGVEGTWAKWM